MTAFLPLIIALIGLLMYGFASNPKVNRIGEIMFFCGLLAFLIPFGNKPINLLR